MYAQTAMRYLRTFRHSPCGLQGCVFSPKVTQLPLLCVPRQGSPEQQHRSAWFNVGDKVSETRKVTLEDVQKFAELTGDDNPLHVDPEFSKNSRFGKPIVHGIFTASLGSALLGTKLPGTESVLLEYNTTYTSPLFVDHEVNITVEATSITSRFAEFSIVCSDTTTKKVVMTGKAKVLIPKTKVNS